jgi:hypothetical protein
MTDPITPPPELIEQWMQDHTTKYDLARHAAQWGADQELQACCSEVAWLESTSMAKKIRARRRPKPPSDKELALNALSLIMSRQNGMFDGKPFDTIRRALEALPE